METIEAIKFLEGGTNKGISVGSEGIRMDTSNTVESEDNMDYAMIMYLKTLELIHSQSSPYPCPRLLRIRRSKSRYMYSFFLQSIYVLYSMFYLFALSLYPLSVQSLCSISLLFALSLYHLLSVLSLFNLSALFLCLNGFR